MSSVLYRNAFRRASALGQRKTSTGIPDSMRTQHYVNNHSTAFPFSGFSQRRPTVFKFIFYGSFLTGFIAPFIVCQYQLTKQNKYLGWHDPEDY